MIGRKKSKHQEIPVEKKRYSWPPPEPAYVLRERNPIHSVLTALPVIMLIVGLYFYYDAESDQSQGFPIRAESLDIDGVFTGLSVVKSGMQGRHYLWVEDNGATRGIRIRPDQVHLMQNLERGVEVKLSIAPTVAGSGTYWAWRVSQGGEETLNMNLVIQ